MDMSNMAKILALIAIAFVGYMLWKNMSEKKISPPHTLQGHGKIHELCRGRGI